MRAFTSCFAFVCLTMWSIAEADNWPHWRGPAGNGAAFNATPPTKWSQTQNVKWKIAIPGREISSPVVWENRVFVSTAAPLKDSKNSGAATYDFKLFCFDRNNGNLIWEKTAVTAQPHEGTHETNGFASASPCTDGKHVYAHFGSRGLYCYSLDGELRWKRDDFVKMQTLRSFGEGSSPTVEGDVILVPWDHNGPSALYAINKLTGQDVWKTNRDEPTCWATPLVVEHAGRKQIIMNGQNFARSYDLESGKELWRCGGQTKRPVASPVSANGLVFIGSGYQGAFLGAFRLDGTGDIKGSDQVVWTVDRDTPDIASPLLSAGRLYFHKQKSGMLSCFDAATGKPHYLSQRIEGVDSVYASPVAAGGHVYISGRNGITTVIKDSNELTVVDTNDLGETISASPAPVDQELFLRGETHLFCIATLNTKP